MPHINYVQHFMFKVPCIVNVFQSMTNKLQHCTVFYFCKLLYVFRVDPPPIIRSTTLYLQHLVLVKLLLLSNNSLTSTRCCRYSVVLLMMGGGSTRNT